MVTQALGKGLSALLEDEVPIMTAPQEETQNAHSDQNSLSATSQPTVKNKNGLDITMLSPLQLKPGPYQPREIFDEEKLNELAESIKENGMIQPIIVRATNISHEYQIIAGERRWRACNKLGLSEIPTIVRDITDKQALEYALIENIQRQNLSPVEEADGYARLQRDFNYTQEELAKGLGKSRSHIANMLRLLDLPDGVKSYLHSGALSTGHARALITCKDPQKVADHIVDKGLSVREAEKFASGYGKNKTAAQKHIEKVVSDIKKDEDIVAIERSLTEQTGLKVSIIQQDDGGKVTINFNNLAELDKIIQAFGTWE